MSAIFQHDGKTYAVERVDTYGQAGDDELVVHIGTVMPKRMMPAKDGWQNDLIVVVREVAPASPFAGEGRAYGPDCDGDQLRIRIPKGAVFELEPSMPRGALIVEHERVRDGEVIETKVSGVYVDPARLVSDLADHFKAIGITPQKEAE